VRRITLMLASMALMIGVVASVAWAEDIECQVTTQEHPCLGTNQDDTITVLEPSLDNFIDGLGGNDIITGGEGNDTLSGGSGDDEVKCGSGNDSCFGLAGDDELRGGGGPDDLEAGNGDDTVFAGAGNDRIDVRGDQQFGFQDEVFCGPGKRDFLAADPNDLFFPPSTCELPH
jgi:RTX calcium-binding nonapeptide repeat (4 copies)